MPMASGRKRRDGSGKQGKRERQKRRAPDALNGPSGDELARGRC